jgi:hypothetical protein
MEGGGRDNDFRGGRRRRRRGRGRGPERDQGGMDRPGAHAEREAQDEFEGAGFEGAEFAETHEEEAAHPAVHEFDDDVETAEETEAGFERGEASRPSEAAKGGQPAGAAATEEEEEIEGASADDEPDIIWENTAETARDTDMSDIPGRPGLKRRRGGRRR